jgi:hypothetical protein
MAVAVSTTAGREFSVGRRQSFFVFMALALIAVVLTGFTQRYYMRLVSDKPLPLIVHIHAVAFLGWMLLFLAQSTLIARNRVSVHRQLGAIAALLSPIIILLGLATAVTGARDGWNPGGFFPDAAGFMFVSITDVLLFAGFFVAALAYRHRKEIHGRLMLLAVIGGFLWPAITRLPYVSPRVSLMFGAITILVAAGPVHDLASRRRIHPAYLIGAGAIAVVYVLRVPIGASAAWHEIATWLIR